MIYVWLDMLNKMSSFDSHQEWWESHAYVCYIYKNNIWAKLMVEKDTPLWKD